MDLRQIIGEDKLLPEKAKIVADFVRKAYFVDIKYYKPVKREIGGKPDMGMNKNNTSIAIINIQVGQFNQTIPFTSEGIELAKGFLELLKKQIKNLPNESLNEEVK
jgi:hypothetical protein